MDTAIAREPIETLWRRLSVKDRVIVRFYITQLLAATPPPPAAVVADPSESVH